MQIAKSTMLNNISRDDGTSVTNNNSQPPLHPNLQGSGSQSIPCDSAQCEQRAVSWVDFRFFCVDHLVSHCYDRLEECERAGSTHRTAREERQRQLSSRFLDECSARIASLLITHTELENIERARLLDILLWANELDRKQRSSQTPI